MLRTRELIEQEERERLAPYAARAGESRGRLVLEPEHGYRSAFQRDRDRIVHSRAFRRLEYKTQVFVHHEGDHYRNRLTHTLEGAQIARTITRVLRLNEDLAEAIALAHDLGHTPFGHAGERVLDQLMRDAGGFDHNRQSLRVVDVLEERYPTFHGLNLTHETREGMLKHGCNWSHPVPLPDLGHQRSLEAQAADLADEIAYTNHDLDDGLRSGILELHALAEVPLWAETRRRVEARLSSAPEEIRRAQTIVAIINTLVTDLIETTHERVLEAAVQSVDSVRETRDTLMGNSEPLRRQLLELKRFLAEHFYHHPRVSRATREAEALLQELFEAHRRDPTRIPTRHRAHGRDEPALRSIADYIAGMTDRYAMSEHEKLAVSGD